MLGAVVLVLSFWLLVGYAVAAGIRRRRRLERAEARSHRSYLRTRRDQWLTRWLFGSRAKRLTYQPEDV
jgi:hypothetical protein